jgi:hypothetical protein
VAADETSTAGFLSSLLDSFRSHVEERARSPFAGAFVFSWVAFNWQSLLVVIFSARPIEERIEAVLPRFQSIEYTVLWPLLLTLVVLLSYYLLSTFFLAVAEIHRVAMSWVERGFQTVGWVSAERVTKAKEKYLKKIQDLVQLAADNTDEISRANSLAADAQKEVLALQAELASDRDKLAKAKSENLALTENLKVSAGLAELLQVSIQGLSDDRDEIKGALMAAKSSLVDQRIRLRTLFDEFQERRKRVQGNLSSSQPNRLILRPGEVDQLLSALASIASSVDDMDKLLASVSDDQGGP